jgi:ribonuclease VapC
MSNVFILDSSAVLAAVLHEPGANRVLGLDGRRIVSTVNVAEVRTRMIDLGYENEEAESAFAMIGLEEVSFSSSQAKTASDLRPLTRKGGLSLGDRACLALAMALGGTALTADRAWAALDLPVSIELIR